MIGIGVHSFIDGLIFSITFTAALTTGALVFLYAGVVLTVLAIWLRHA